MDKLELIQHAADSNAFKSTDTSAGYINPEYWNRQVLRSTESSLVVTQIAKVYNDLLDNDGDTLNITIGVEGAVAGALTETTAVTIDAQTYTQVVFTPTEYGAAYQVTDKEARRSFFSLMEDITAKLGYRLARKRENYAAALLTSGTGNAVVANGVASSAIASSDTLDYVDVINAIAEVTADKFTTTGGFLFVAARQYGSLLKDSQFSNAYQYGGREAVLNGEVGMIAGLKVLVADEIAVANSKAKALVVGKNKDGTPALGIAYKARPKIEMERHALDRTTDIVAVEEWDMKVLHANAICTIETYCA
jgi:N4-gp56 family major capsid protein